MNPLRKKLIGKDIDSYMAQKRGVGFFGFGKNTKTNDDGYFSKKERMSEPQPITEAPEQVRSDTMEEASSQEQESEEKRGWFSRFFSGESKEEQEPALQMPVVDSAMENDFKEIARISLGFIKLADEEARIRIKNSPDFERFKEILRNRQIIK